MKFRRKDASYQSKYDQPYGRPLNNVTLLSDFVKKELIKAKS